MTDLMDVTLSSNYTNQKDLSIIRFHSKSTVKQIKVSTVWQPQMTVTSYHKKYV